ncbi:Alpha/Beta hydrolase protein [Lasiosphaeria hispida]|uniref:Alpha/Beta hydrolase protein n=1 Tax=Lasiosphaeria hispida TaxID=260671 RepID=A0AAJ0HDR7_9PEZI|nr:Alpha/Beta hydrolase protein [Lasiosphaeria hispida]
MSKFAEFHHVERRDGGGVALAHLPPTFQVQPAPRLSCQAPASVSTLPVFPPSLSSLSESTSHLSHHTEIAISSRFSLPSQIDIGFLTIFSLVLIHGLNGSPIETWTHKKSKVCWPRDLLPKQQPLTRVLSFGYSADIFKNTSVAGIRMNSRSLLSALFDKREDIEDQNRPIVFLAHSLGGLVAKQALRFANNEHRFSPLAAATRGLIFYGTPHTGSDKERWQTVAKAFAPLVPIGGRGEMSPLVDALLRNSKDICDISEDFIFLSRNYALINFYEAHVFPGTSKPIVEQMDATMRLDHETALPINSDHMNICRFKDSEDAGFQNTYRRIKEASRGGPNQVPMAMPGQFPMGMGMPNPMQMGGMPPYMHGMHMGMPHYMMNMGMPEQGWQTAGAANSHQSQQEVRPTQAEPKRIEQRQLSFPIHGFPGMSGQGFFHNMGMHGQWSPPTYGQMQGQQGFVEPEQAQASKARGGGLKSRFPWR